MKKILVTGANGFIGSFLVEEALKRNYEVYAGIRRDCDTHYLNDNRITFFEIDFQNTDKLKKRIGRAPKFDYIIHNAGITNATHKSDYLLVNYQYTKNFIESLISEGKAPDRFIYMSSLSAFGPAKSSLVKLNDNPQPVTKYGNSKLESEKYITGLKGFPYLILRPTAVYGPRDKELLRFIKLINANLEIYIGNKDQSLTFIFVKDLAKATFNAIESGICNKAYFVTDGETYRRHSLGKIIRTELKKRTIRMNIPSRLARIIAFLIEKTQNFKGKSTLISPEKINELLGANWNCEVQPLQMDTGFHADYDLKKGISETISWYKYEHWL